MVSQQLEFLIALFAGSFYGGDYNPGMDARDEHRAKQLVELLEKAGLNHGLLLMQGQVVLRGPGFTLFGFSNDILRGRFEQCHQPWSASEEQCEWQLQQLGMVRAEEIESNSMPCEVHDKLQRDWQLKLNTEISAHDGYKGPANAVVSQRSLTTTERVAVEVLWQNHIRDCGVCKSEGREPHVVNPTRIID